MEDNSTILSTLLEIKEDIGSIKATLEANKETYASQDQKTNHIAARLAAVETQQNRWKWTTAGAAGVFVALFKAIELWWSSGGTHH